MLALYYLVYVVGTKLHRKRLSSIMNKYPTLLRFSANTMQWIAFYGVAGLFLTSTTGVSTEQMLAKIFGVGGIAFGFAAQTTVSNLISGVILLLAAPFKIGDHVVAGGESGWVLEIGLMHTYINTDKHVRVLLPNAKILSSKIVNNSQLVARKVSITIACPETEDIPKSRKHLMDAASEVDEKIKKLVANMEPSHKDYKRDPKTWRFGGVEGRGRPLHALKSASVSLADIDGKTVKWNIEAWAPNSKMVQVKDMLIEASLAKMKEKCISCAATQ